MTTLTVARVAELPRINLLPPEIEQAARLRKLQVLLGVLLLAVLGVVGLLFTWANTQVSAANDSLTTAQAEGVQLQQQVDSYAKVPEVQAQVTSAEDALVTAMTPEIRWSYLMNDMSLAIPSTSRLITWTATNTAAAAQVGSTTTTAPTTTLAPAEESMGSVTYKGSVHKFEDAATWLNSLAGQSSYTDPTLTSEILNVPTTTQGRVWTVDSGATLSLDAASNRFEQVLEGE